MSATDTSLDIGSAEDDNGVVQRTSSSNTDIAVLVPKLDELHWIAAAFQFDLGDPTRHLSFRGKPIYDQPVVDSLGNEIRVSFLALEGQGQVDTAVITREVVHELRPALAFIVGTALGNPARSKIADVVFAESVTDLSETKVDDAQSKWRPHQVEPPGRMRREVGRFKESLTLAPMRRELKALIDRKVTEEVPPSLARFSVHFEALASGGAMVGGATVADKIWEHDDRLACYDMESGGFGRALDDRESLNVRDDLPWMVVRGVSDYGTPESKSDTHRAVSTLAAALVLREFITVGLKQCHPFQLRPPTDASTEIPETHFYVRKAGTNYFRARLQSDLGVDLPLEQPSRPRTIGALAALLCPLLDRPRSEVIEYLDGVRANYFEDKYLDYTYDHDLRSLLPGWAIEVKEIIRGELNMRLSGLDVLDVGIGNGLEIAPLFDSPASVVGVDVSERLLKAAKKRAPAIKTICTTAESLVGVDSRSVDLYVSLRTYMSRMFDSTRALEQAIRVLRPDGGILLSIADGYLVDQNTYSRRLLRGLKVPSSDAVDSEEPHRIAQRLRRKLWDFGFEDVGYVSAATDVYIWGRAPAAAKR
jgi:SAM-dependent methyltransferase/nucleoside phosphorylase